MFVSFIMVFENMISYIRVKGRYGKKRKVLRCMIVC